MATTLAELRALVRQRLGWPSADTFVVDDEMDSYIRASAQELYALLVTVHGPDFLVEEEEIATAPGTATYDLSEDFGRLIRIDCDLGNGHRVPFRKGNLASHVFAPPGRGWSLGNEVTYFFSYSPESEQSFLRFDPVPQAVYTVHVFISENEVVFEEDDDENPIGHDEYIILDVCAKCRVKEESDANDFLGQKAAYEQRLKTLASPVDIGQPQTIADMRGARAEYGDNGWWRR